jgi:hypothetical protein
MMKIANFKRDADNNVVAIGEDGTEVIVPTAYIESNKPRIGDSYGSDPVQEPIVEVTVEPIVEAVVETVVEPIVEIPTE